MITLSVFSSFFFFKLFSFFSLSFLPFQASNENDLDVTGVHYARLYIIAPRLTFSWIVCCENEQKMKRVKKRKVCIFLYSVHMNNHCGRTSTRSGTEQTTKKKKTATTKLNLNNDFFLPFTFFAFNIFFFASLLQISNCT